MQHNFSSIIAKEHFQKNPPDALDITIFELMSINAKEPFDAYDVMLFLEEKGIPGYDQETVEERLKRNEDHYELIKVRTGYLQTTESHQFMLQMSSVFKQCRRPTHRVLKKAYRPHLHTYIEDGTDTKHNHRVPVPTGARIFARIYTTYTSKYHTEFYSHIYGFKVNNGPFTPIEIWFHGHHA